jgi:hypothetical protein
LTENIDVIYARFLLFEPSGSEVSYTEILNVIQSCGLFSAVCLLLNLKKEAKHCSFGVLEFVKIIGVGKLCNC